MLVLTLFRNTEVLFQNLDFLVFYLLGISTFSNIFRALEISNFIGSASTTTGFWKEDKIREIVHEYIIKFLITCKKKVDFWKFMDSRVWKC